MWSCQSLLTYTTYTLNILSPNTDKVNVSYHHDKNLSKLDFLRIRKSWIELCACGWWNLYIAFKCGSPSLQSCVVVSKNNEILNYTDGKYLDFLDF
jgi:hypothetical protein